MATIFKTVPWKVESLVSDVSSGAIQLPDLQRPFVWPAAKVRDLLDSMYKGDPVGELMFWDLADEQVTHSIATDAKYQVGLPHAFDGATSTDLSGAIATVTLGFTRGAI